ncbi:response regulator transcription factor [Verticiella sediminum]|uniref:Response regulator transcription factor n=2 Tax=Verticiella sediminum TaxID=1247510 RepID=A0A556AZQ6_9BURK|nr:response regulator transcription factor [Verticiella sediminum]
MPEPALLPAAIRAQPVVGLLEDDDDLREELRTGLERMGFAVWDCATAADFHAELGRRPCHVAIIDVGLPDEDGFSVSARLRVLSQVGIVMLSGRSAIEDRVRGLQGAADAYLVKPVDLRELAAVLTAVLRRAWAGADTPTARSASAQSDDWRVDVAERALVAPGDAWRLRLTQSESAMLVHLLGRGGEPASRQQILEAIDPLAGGEHELHRVDMLVSRLRRKAESVGVELPIRSVRGHGYRFALSRNDE